MKPSNWKSIPEKIFNSVLPASLYYNIPISSTSIHSFMLSNAYHAGMPKNISS